MGVEHITRHALCWPLRAPPAATDPPGLAPAAGRTAERRFFVGSPAPTWRSARPESHHLAREGGSPDPSKYLSRMRRRDSSRPRSPFSRRPGRGEHTVARWQGSPSRVTSPWLHRGRGTSHHRAHFVGRLSIRYDSRANRVPAFCWRKSWRVFVWCPAGTQASPCQSSRSPTRADEGHNLSPRRTDSADVAVRPSQLCVPHASADAAELFHRHEAASNRADAVCEYSGRSAAKEAARTLNGSVGPTPHARLSRRARCTILEPQLRAVLDALLMAAQARARAFTGVQLLRARASPEVVQVGPRAACVRALRRPLRPAVDAEDIEPFPVRLFSPPVPISRGRDGSTWTR